ncbi:trichohyalin-like [Amphibalanus amphitrite]|uniref:trichohyalin-like n=1 Tax=Amphibalanus amphitrite TaxID=1232801 RepID=UPI001C907759|nr:trichohyalin-like [Amphibalanus amphitrite]
MAVFSSGYCKITGLSKAMPESHFIPIMPALSQSEQAQLFGCKITMAAHMDHHYVPVIEFGKGKGPGVVACKITGHQAESVARSVPLPEEGAEVKRVHRFKRDLRYMEPFVSRLANAGERAAMDELLEKMRTTTQLDPAQYFVYSLHDRRTGKTGMVLSYEYEEAIRSGAIESILLSGDSNSLVVRIKDGPMCTIPMDKVGKMQIERLSEDEMLFDGRGPDREIIEQQRREKAAREKEDREQMAEYLAEMERKRKERDLRKKEKMKETMKRKMAEAEEAEKRQKAMDEEIKRQYEDAARIRAEAEAAKAAAREAMLEKRAQKDAEARARRAEELAEQARLAEEQLQREEAERQAQEEARLAQEAAAAEALAAVDPHDMSVNELLEHMRERTEDEALLRDMEEAASIGMSSKQLADMVITSTIEAIEEEFAEPEEEDEEEEEEESEDEEDGIEDLEVGKPRDDQVDAQTEGMTEEERRKAEEERKIEEEMLRQLREEQLEMKRKEREAKRLERQRKREELERKEEEKRLKKEARERRRGR